DSTFDKLFAFGIDPVGGGLPDDQPSDWPSLANVHEYVRQVRKELDDDLAVLNLSEQADREFAPSLLLNVAIEHRLMHAETLAYMLHQLAYEKKIKASQSQRLDSAFRASSSIEIPAGTIALGLSRNAETFGWDNEYERHVVDVPAFTIDRYKVTNREYLEFMAAGGYERRALWTDADWAWKDSQRISNPAFWVRRGEDWFWKGMFEEIPLPFDWPVYVSHAEASAYAQWAGKALPTEAEWQRAAYGTPRENFRIFPWGVQSPTSAYGNFDFNRWDPVSTFAHAQGASAF